MGLHLHALICFIPAYLRCFWVTARPAPVSFVCAPQIAAQLSLVCDCEKGGKKGGHAQDVEEFHSRHTCLRGVYGCVPCVVIALSWLTTPFTFAAAAANLALQGCHGGVHTARGACLFPSI